MKKAISYMACSMAAMLALSACGSAASSASTVASSSDAASTESTAASEASNEPVTITFAQYSGSGDNEQYLQQMVDNYMKENPNVTIDLQTYGYDDYFTPVTGKVSGGQAPDVFELDYQNFVSYAKKGALMPLDDILTKDGIDTSIYNDMALKAFSADGVQYGVPDSFSNVVLIYNKDLLAKYIATDGAKIKSADDIDNFDTLKAVADDIQAKKDQLGVKGAFTSAGFDSSSDWRFKTHLANLPLYYEFKDDNVTKQPETIKGTYLPEYKNIFDLYLKDSTTEPTQLSSKTGDDSTSEFSLGEAVFYQNGTWAWTDLQKAGMKADSLGMLPIYIGVKGEEKQGLATGSENYWCINSKASDADKKATKDFLKWVVTSKTGIKSLSSDMGFTTPFKSFSDVKSDNPLVQAAVEDQNSDKTAVSWNFTMMPSEEWKNKVGQALLEYAQGTGKWDAVKTAFVDGWASEYEASH